jgi:hypothetical protein
MLTLTALLRHRITWGVGIALGVFVALAAHGRLKYTEGHRAGTAAAQAVAARDALTARAVADSAWRALHEAGMAVRDSLRVAEAAAARARARSAAADARLANALAVFAADTSTQIPATCSDLATACRNAAAAWSAERDSLSAVTETQGRALTLADAQARAEPTRTAAAVTVAVQKDRATYRHPSRLHWLVGGAVVGALTTWSVTR